MQAVEGGGTVEVDSSSAAVRAAWSARARARRELLEERVRRAQVDLVEVSSDQDPADALIAAFARRARRGGAA